MKLKQLFGGLLAAALLGASAPVLAAEMIVSSEVAASHWKTQYMMEFAKKVKERTGGEIDVKVFPSGQLFNDQDALASLGTGSVHMVWPVSVRLETIAPQLGLINLPFSLTDEQMTNKCYAQGLSQAMSNELKNRNLEVLSLLRTADLLFIFKDKDVKQLSDLAGTKLRVTGGRVFLDMIRSLGASPISMAASEMSTALSQGAIDGVYTSPAGWAEMIGTTGKYAYYIPNLSLATYAVVVDKAWMESIKPEHRKIINETIKDIALGQWEEAKAADAKLIKKMIDQGSLYRTASQQDMDKIKAMTEKSRKEFQDKHPEIVKQIADLAVTCKR
jgi:C4-dicarboxylate-binding protein DctP